jgi:hypothetical protein
MTKLRVVFRNFSNVPRRSICFAIFIYRLQTTRVQNDNTWADHLIPGLIFFLEIIIRSEMATEWDSWKLCTSVCAKPEEVISPNSHCGGPWVNVYNSVHRISRWRRKYSSVCALISVSVWGKLVLKRTKCCNQLSECPA